MPSLKYARLYADEAGESHFEDVEVELTEPMSASILSPTIPVTGMNLRLSEAEYSLDFHPAPRRQFIVNLSGEVEITASDGEVRRFGPGSIFLVEDVTGKGHKSRATSSERRVSLFIHLPAE